MWTFVTFHADLGDETHQKLQKRGVDLMMHASYEAQINWLFRSAERLYPACRKVVITDQNTQLDAVIGAEIEGEIEIFRAQAPGSGAMLSRTRAQTEWLESEAARGAAQAQPIVMLDSDILINRDLEPLCEAGYDLALTYRGNDKMPLNGGVFFVAPGQRGAALHFLRWVQLIYETRFPDALWYGDQYALIEAVGWDNYRKVADNGAEILSVPIPVEAVGEGPTVRVRLWHVGEWNHTVGVKWKQLKKLPSARVLHFKGPRKLLMRPYFYGWLQPPPSRLKRFGWRFLLYVLAGLQKTLKRANNLRRLLSWRKGVE